MILKTAEIITIGDELLIGQTLNTNVQWIGNELDAIGIKPTFCTTIGDQPQTIKTTLDIAKSRADLVLITGGLGPTKDDLTKKVLAEYFDTELVMDEQRLTEIEAYFEQRNRPINELNKLQALTPKSCTPITNLVGTANGMWFEESNNVFISMPGVPFEMKNMMRETILPRLEKYLGDTNIAHKTIKTIGIGESDLSILIEEWENNLPEYLKLAYLPSYGQVKLRLSANLNKPKTELLEEINDEFSKIYPLIDKYIYGYDDEITLEQAVANLLLEKNLTIATAESCTGGALASILTSISGSSNYFKGSIIAYSNEVKTSQLGVLEETLKAHGAVSEPTIIEMATNVRTKLKTDIGVATSGIAGPTGGTPDKPVGTIWIAFSDGKTCITKKLQLSKDRSANVKYTCTALLNVIRVQLSGLGELVN